VNSVDRAVTFDRNRTSPELGCLTALLTLRGDWRCSLGHEPCSAQNQRCTQTPPPTHGPRRIPRESTGPWTCLPDEPHYLAAPACCSAYDPACAVAVYPFSRRRRPRAFEALAAHVCAKNQATSTSERFTARTSCRGVRLGERPPLGRRAARPFGGRALEQARRARSAPWTLWCPKHELRRARRRGALSLRPEQQGSPRPAPESACLGRERRGM